MVYLRHWIKQRRLELICLHLILSSLLVDGSSSSTWMYSAGLLFVLMDFPSSQMQVLGKNIEGDKSCLTLKNSGFPCLVFWCCAGA